MSDKTKDLDTISKKKTDVDEAASSKDKEDQDVSVDGQVKGSTSEPSIKKRKGKEELEAATIEVEEEKENLTTKDKKVALKKAKIEMKKEEIKKKVGDSPQSKQKTKEDKPLEVSKGEETEFDNDEDSDELIDEESGTTKPKKSADDDTKQKVAGPSLF